jgi:hypothetical protein
MKEEVVGIVFDLVHTRPSSQKCQKDGGAKWIVERRMSGRQEWEIEEWRESTMEYCERIVKGKFVKNSEACFSYNKTCEYIDVCNTDGKFREHVIERNFRVEKWTPYEGR